MPRPGREAPREKDRQRAIVRNLSQRRSIVKTLRVVERRAADHAFGLVHTRTSIARQVSLPMRHQVVDPVDARKCPRPGCGEGAGQRHERAEMSPSGDAEQRNATRVNPMCGAFSVEEGERSGDVLRVARKRRPVCCPPVVNARDGEAALGEVSAPCGE